MSLSTEKVFDMLPSVVDLYDKLNLEEYIKKIKKENKGKNKVDSTIAGINMFKYILKNSKKIKEECFEIVAVFEDKPVAEIKNQNFVETMSVMKEIFTDKETTDFFKQAMQSEDMEKA